MAVSEGELEPGTLLLGNTRLLRTFGFFRVASELPVKSKPDEGKIVPLSEKRFNELMSV